MHSRYRTMLHVGMICAAIGAGATFNALHAAPKATTIKHTDGLSALVTPECREWQQCEDVAKRSCPREFFQTLQWQEIQIGSSLSGRVAARGERALDPGITHFALTFRCYPSATSVVVELIDGRDGLKIGPCMDKPECETFARSLCPTGYFQRESLTIERKYPPSFGRDPDEEAIYWNIRCEATHEEPAE